MEPVGLLMPALIGSLVTVSINIDRLTSQKPFVLITVLSRLGVLVAFDSHWDNSKLVYTDYYCDVEWSAFLKWTKNEFKLINNPWRIIKDKTILLIMTDRFYLCVIKSLTSTMTSVENIWFSFLSVFCNMMMFYYASYKRHSKTSSYYINYPGCIDYMYIYTMDCLVVQRTKQSTTQPWS